MAALLLALAPAACGGEESARPGLGTELTFDVPAAPGEAATIRLQAIERGTGSVGVVLAHMLGSSQSAWTPLAETLAARGFHVLTFDLRGHGLSGGEREPSRADLDLAGAVARLRGLGVEKMFVVGASIGGTAAVKVAAADRFEGVVALSAPLEARGLSAREDAARLDEPSLFIAAGGDGDYTAAARALYAAAPEPKRLEIIDGSSAHGTNLLEGPARSRVERAIIDFLTAFRE